MQNAECQLIMSPVRNYLATREPEVEKSVMSRQSVIIILVSIFYCGSNEQYAERGN